MDPGSVDDVGVTDIEDFDESDPKTTPCHPVTRIQTPNMRKI